MGGTTEKNDLIRRMKEAASRQMTPEERKAQRVSFIISAIGRDDEATRREVEDYVNGHYGTTDG